MRLSNFLFKKTPGLEANPGVYKTKKTNQLYAFNQTLGGSQPFSYSLFQRAIAF